LRLWNIRRPANAGLAYESEEGGYQGTTYSTDEVFEELTDDSIIATSTMLQRTDSLLVGPIIRFGYRFLHLAQLAPRPRSLDKSLATKTSSEQIEFGVAASCLYISALRAGRKRNRRRVACENMTSRETNDATTPRVGAHLAFSTKSLLRRQLSGEARPVADDQRPHFVIDLLHRVEGFNLQTDDRKFFRREYAALKTSYGMPDRHHAACGGSSSSGGIVGRSFLKGGYPLHRGSSSS
jgi:hypothetical protein